MRTNSQSFNARFCNISLNRIKYSDPSIFGARVRWFSMGYRSSVLSSSLIRSLTRRAVVVRALSRSGECGRRRRHLHSYSSSAGLSPCAVVTATERRFVPRSPQGLMLGRGQPSRPSCALAQSATVGCMWSGGTSQPACRTGNWRAVCSCKCRLGPIRRFAPFTKPHERLD
jgi:hypothetical protein